MDFYTFEPTLNFSVYLRMDSPIRQKYGVLEEALTFDDVLLVPSYSEVLPHQVDTRTRLTTDIHINVPIVTAAMDTVTEAPMAIAVAREGGIGIIHKNMSIEEQAEQVRFVKRSESGMIMDPVTLKAHARVGEALQIMAKYKIGGIPIIDEQGKLIGILTNRDLRFESDLDREVSEVMTAEGLITVPEGTTLERAKEILQKYKIEKLPVVADDNTLRGLITFRDIVKLRDYPNASKDRYGRLLVGAAVGVGDEMMSRVEALVEAGVDVVVVDTAHGHSKMVIDAIRRLRSTYPDLQIIGGNVATGEGAEALVEVGVNAVKVGIGPGSICTTRVVAGVGVPQLTAIMQVYQRIRSSGVPIIADGGIRYTGDIVKAIAAGADSIMAGSLFAGTEEAPGETIIYEGRKFKVYRGMGSLGAMKAGSKDRYFQAHQSQTQKLVPEGIEGRVPYKGTLAEVMVQYIGGLRSGMGYVGAANIEALKGAKMIRITHAGILESHPHNVFITKEAPNYSRKVL